MSNTQDLIFNNVGGGDYFIVAGDDKRALLRLMSRGGYVIAHNLDWVHMCWSSGHYFGDKFKAAAKTFLGEGGGDDDL